ncbi:MAG: HD domain-containing protein [Treponema sp.]|nr:HD domain-containing protein [Treponema sp.]
MDLVLIYKICCEISIAVLGGCLVVLSTRRATEAQKFIYYAFSLVLLYLIGYAVTFIGTSPDMILLGQKLKYIGAFCLILTLFIVFQQVYNVASSVPIMIVLSIDFIFVNGTIIIGNLNSSWAPTKWFCKGIEFLTRTDGKQVILFDGNWGTMVASVSMVTLLIATAVVFFSAVSSAVKRSFRVSMLFFLAAFFPEILIFLSLFQKEVHSFPLVPLVIAVAAIVVTILVCKEKFTNLYDLSYKEIMNSLNTPLFIVDSKFFVHKVNYAAKVLFPEYKTLAVNSYKRLPAIKEIQDIITPPLHESESDNPFGLLSIGNQYFEPELHHLGQDKHIYGYVIALNDVTEQYSRSNELSALASKLSTSLRSDRSRSNEEREKIISGALQFMRDKDPMTAEHMRRMSNYTFIIARELRRMGKFTDILTDAYMETLCQVAPLHDIGKLMLPSEILHKTDLSEEELKLRRSHVNIGSQIVDRMVVNDPKSLYYKLSKEVTLYHHEWWNGQGFPKGLSNEDIPLAARIVAVADVLDTLASRHAEKKNYHFDELINMIQSHSGTYFDPLVVEACVSCKEKLRELYDVLYGKSFSENV